MVLQQPLVPSFSRLSMVSGAVPECRANEMACKAYPSWVHVPKQVVCIVAILGIVMVILGIPGPSNEVPSLLGFIQDLQAQKCPKNTPNPTRNFQVGSVAGYMDPECNIFVQPLTFKRHSKGSCSC